MENQDEFLIKDDEFSPELVADEEFYYFILKEAEDMIAECSLEDLAKFGFGNLEDAVEAYKEHIELLEKMKKEG